MNSEKCRSPHEVRALFALGIYALTSCGLLHELREKTRKLFETRFVRVSTVKKIKNLQIAEKKLESKTEKE